MDKRDRTPTICERFVAQWMNTMAIRKDYYSVSYSNVAFAFLDDKFIDNFLMAPFPKFVLISFNKFGSVIAWKTTVCVF